MAARQLQTGCPTTAGKIGHGGRGVLGAHDRAASRGSRAGQGRVAVFWLGHQDCVHEVQGGLQPAGFGGAPRRQGPRGDQHPGEPAATTRA